MEREDTNAVHKPRPGAIGRAAALLVVTLALPLSACAGNLPSQPVTVTMTNQLKFQPAEITVPAGTTITWKNDSVLVHTVTADPGKAARAKDVALPDGAKTFDSGNLDPDATFSHTFTISGDYRYFCQPHEANGMVGVVHVQASH